MTLKASFIKNAVLLMGIIFGFFSGFYLTSFKEKNDFKMEVYAMALQSLGDQMSLNVVLLKMAKQKRDTEEEVYYKCRFAAYYNATNKFITWVERDQLMPWTKTAYLDEVNDYRGIVLAELGEENPEVFFHDVCLGVIWKGYTP
jgi:hypothetical protein